MNAEEIRAEAIERIARLLFDRSGWPGTWEERSEAQDSVHREGAAVFLGALGDLLPTGEEWGIDAPDAPFPHVVTAMDDEADARAHLDGAPGRKLVRRYVHDWRTEVRG